LNSQETKANAHYLIRYSTTGKFEILSRSTKAQELMEKKGLSRGEVLDGFLEYIAKVFVNKLRVNISTQKGMSKYKPLAKSTIKKKGHARKFINTGQLLRNLTHWKVEGRGDTPTSYYVGFSKSIHHGSTLTNDEIGTILNFGSAKIPARPFISDTAKNISKDITGHLVRYLNTRESR